MAAGNVKSPIVVVDEEEELPCNAKGPPVNDKGRKLKSEVWQHMAREVLPDKSAEQGDVASVSNSTSNVISKETSADIAKEKGNDAFKEKQWTKAISFYTEAIKLNGNNATYYSNRAAAYLELGSFVQAEADCTNAINLDKKNVKAYLHRGTAREWLSYYKEALEDFRYALVLEPTNKRAAVSAERLKNLFQ